MGLRSEGGACYAQSMLKPALALFFLTAVPALLAQEAADVKLPVGARALREVAYVENGHALQKLDLYLPARPAGPLLVMIHGGGWDGGSKDQPEGLTLLGRGYAVANIDYRLSQNAIFPAQIEDCKAAIRWLRAHAAHFGYDPQRIGVWGASAEDISRRCWRRREERRSSTWERISINRAPSPARWISMDRAICPGGERRARTCMCSARGRSRWWCGCSVGK